MGVKGLWKLVGPVGRPVLLESVEGKAMAIDSSIWLYQFQATMRDKDGRALVNAHIVGFLRRICKLLFYGIKHVFVFDGGAPALKKATITERKKRKSGFAASHAKLAEKILVAQMRREAIKQVQAQTKKIPKLTDDMVYLEDYDDPNFLKSPPKKAPVQDKPAVDVSPSKKKHKFHDHDPYRLPDVDLEAAIASATRSAIPDPRLATEEELREFIDNMRPEDFDVTSPAFRELPTEVKYEIIGDLRLKSRQTSYKRLQSMLRAAPTALDFSKAQIKFLQQRNSLTQQLLETTDSISQAHVSIPIRVASERNRQYVLTKNEGPDGGWVLARHDIGTVEKPIEIDMDDARIPVNDEDDSDDMEEVQVGPEPAPDPDMREYRRHLGLSAIGVRHSPEKPIPSRSASSSRSSSAPAKKQPLFTPNLGDWSDEDDDPELNTAIAQSLESEELRQAIVASKVQQSPAQRAIENSSRLTLAHAINSRADGASRTAQVVAPQAVWEDSDDDTDLYVNPPPNAIDKTSVSTEHNDVGIPSTQSTLSTNSLAPPPGTPSFGPAIFLRAPVEPATSTPPRGGFGSPSLPLASRPSIAATDQTPVTTPTAHRKAPISSNTGTVAWPAASSLGSVTPVPRARYDASQPPAIEAEPIAPSTDISSPLRVIAVPGDAVAVDSEDDVEMEEPHQSRSSTQSVRQSPLPADVSAPLPDATRLAEIPEPELDLRSSSYIMAATVAAATVVEAAEDDDDDDDMEEAEIPPVPAHRTQSPPPLSYGQGSVQISSPSPTQPAASTSYGVVESLSPSHNEESPPSSPVPRAVDDDDEAAVEEDWDAAQEMDPVAEESEFAEFFSQVKGRSLDAVRAEIDSELYELNKARKAAQRDSEDVTQQMVAQIQVLLRLFGIPYITAPMEAEAQCAALVELELVEGVITDDSDVFLFGAENLKVFKNMFNQSKTVECFVASDLVRELGLERDKLIRLAYLLGSDYVDGVPGVGPVLAMEILAEFPGKDGLLRFRDWWMKVQTGKDRPEDTASTFRRRFKKKFKSLHLTDDWPNPLVRDAYYHPAVDNSDEPFKWGLPDLDALQHFLNQELGWAQGKVEDLLLPIIHRMRQRGQAGGPNKQGTLSAFFDVSVGTGTYAPRKKQAYASKRLQKIVQDYRKERRERGGSTTPGPAREPRSAEPSSSRAADAEDSLSRAEEDDMVAGNNSRVKRKRKAAPDSNQGKAKKRRVQSKLKGKKSRADSADGANEDGSGEELRGRVVSDVAPNRELRPRRAAGGARPVVDDVDNNVEDDEEDDEDAFVRRRRRR